ncbi:MAG: hypothetical protein M3619_00670 [Myxococcota bacterium]|nr:hypothetical protein [Myxococcota bacterium]
MTIDRSKLLEQVLPLACRASFDVSNISNLRAGGKVINNALRDELLAKCATGQYVEIELDLNAYEQKAGEVNRNFVRFRDGAMMALGRSGVDTPYLRDHEQGDSLAVGGTITASATEKRAEGDYAIKQTTRLTAPWAVELALRGLMRAVSIGWRPTGPVLCSACNTEIFEKCWHWPGDRLTEVTDEDGKKRRQRKSDGELTVEWVFTSAELVETSSVPVPGVATAAIEAVRTSLSANPVFRAMSAHEGEDLPREESIMKSILAALVATLSLAPTAGEDEVIKAVDDLKRDRDTARKELSIADTENTKLSAIVEEHREKQRKVDEDTFVRDALSSGRITKGDEGAWRDLYQLDATKAAARMNERKAGCATPVGQPRQSEIVPPPAANADHEDVKAALTANGVDADQAIGMAKLFGAKTPEKTIARAIGMKQES